MKLLTEKEVKLFENQTLPIMGVKKTLALWETCLTLYEVVRAAEELENELELRGIIHSNVFKKALAKLPKEKIR